MSKKNAGTATSPKASKKNAAKAVVVAATDPRVDAERAARAARADAKKAEAGEAIEAVAAPIYVGPKGGIPKVTVKPGRSKFSGMVIVRAVAENPRRPGTYGNRAFGYYAARVDEGVPFDAFREAVERDPKILGGLNHLVYDLNKGFVKAVPASEFKGKVVAPKA